MSPYVTARQAHRLSFKIVTKQATGQLMPSFVSPKRLKQFFFKENVRYLIWTRFLKFQEPSDDFL